MMTIVMVVVVTMISRNVAVEWLELHIQEVLSSVFGPQSYPLSLKMCWISEVPISKIGSYWFHVSNTVHTLTEKRWSS
jgi:hypothetical protein